MQRCRGCDRELHPRDVREAVIESTNFGRELYGPLCPECAAPLLAGMSFAQWLDVQWERQKARMAQQGKDNGQHDRRRRPARRRSAAA